MVRVPEGRHNTKPYPADPHLSCSPIEHKLTRLKSLPTERMRTTTLLIVRLRQVLPDRKASNAIATWYSPRSESLARGMGCCRSRLLWSDDRVFRSHPLHIRSVPQTAKHGLRMEARP